MMTTPDTVFGLDIETISIRKAAMIYRAINHRFRQQILFLLHKTDRLSVTEIYCSLRSEQSVASQHLAILRRADLVRTERKGKYVFYSINYARLSELHDVALELLEVEVSAGPFPGENGGNIHLNN